VVNVPLEIHPLNPNASREPGGIWNESTLPVTAWENPHERVVLPGDLQEALAIPTPVLRWRAEKLDKVKRKHPETAHLPMTITELLNDWEFAGPQPGKNNTWNVFIPGGGGYMIAVFAIRYRDSYNVVSVYSPRSDWLAARIVEGKDMWIERKK